MRYSPELKERIEGAKAGPGVPSLSHEKGGNQGELPLDPPGDETAPEAPEQPTALASPKTGVLATNDRNLMYMLAAGLLMPPSGFGGKHYRDTLSAFPGWLPLFIGPGGGAPSPPSAAVEDSTRETGHLRPVLVEVDLRRLGGTVRAHGSDGWTERRLEGGVAAEESLLLFPAPLPVSRIRSVVLRSDKERKVVKDNASDFGNVSFQGLDLIADEARFDSLSADAWPPPDGPAERSVALAAAQAAGGVMAVLHQLANTGDLSLRAARCAFDMEFDPPDDPILRALPKWIANPSGQTSEGTPKTGQDLFWGAVGRIVRHRDQDGQDDPNDALAAFYREAAKGMEGELRARAGAVVTTIESLGGGLGDDTVSRMLDRHPTPAGRAAILFLLRRRSRELFELIRDYPQLEERDRLAAGILFGVRDGWLKLPLALRGSPELANAVTHRMAALAHRLDRSGCDLGSAPTRVRPLREVFGDPGRWGPAEERAALWLANELDWKDSRRFTVSLGRGSYTVRIEGGSVHIDCADRPQVDTHVDHDRFFAHLAGSRIDVNVEAAVRAHLR